LGFFLPYKDHHRCTITRAFYEVDLIVLSKRAGITTVVLPKKNEKDLEEVPASAKAGMTFKFVEEMGEVLSLTLRPSSKKSSPSE